MTHHPPRYPLIECPKGEQGCGRQHERCTSHNRRGGPCGQLPLRVSGDRRRCRNHLGMRAEVLRAEYAAHQTAVERFEIAKRHNLQDEVDPLSAMVEVTRDALQWKRVCQEMVGSLTEVRYKSSEATEQLRAEVLLFERSMDRVARIAADAVRLNIEERLARISVKQADQVVGVVRAILSDLALSAEQLALVGEVVPRRMRELRAVEAAQ